ncbi:lipopolysaccharide biosynthesis protein [Aequorivita sp. Q41]|uniref:lipopolysaccharide biosynthesis protein n=1 Tax=Aequorivita sp. Q41 TaxID=3153300 RepID=UPI0032426395
MSVFKQIKNGGLWSALETGGMILCQFLYIIFMARFLDKADFGLMAIVNAILNIGSIITDGGMGAALIQKQGITNKHKNAALQGGFLLGSIFFLTFLLGAEQIAHFFNNAQLPNLLRVSAISFIFLSLSSVSLNLLYKTFNFRYTSIVALISIFVGYTIGVIMGFYGYGVWSLVFASLTVTLLKTIGYFYFAPIKIKYGFYFKEWKELFGFGSGMILLKFSTYLSNGGVNLLLAKTLPVSTLGVFERSSQIKSLPSKHLGDILNKVMFPIMSQIQDEKERLFKVFYYGLGISNSILFPLTLYLVYFSNEIVNIMLGDKWTEAVIPLQIMFLVLPFAISNRMADSAIRAKGLIYKNVVRKCIYIVVLLSSTFILGYYYGIIGAAIAVTGSYIFNYLLMIHLIKKIFKKTFKEIFYVSLRESLRLTFLVGILLLLYHFTVQYFTINYLITFSVFSILMVISVGGLVLTKPKFFGTFINDLVISFKKKKIKKL